MEKIASTLLLIGGLTWMGAAAAGDVVIDIPRPPESQGPTATPQVPNLGPTAIPTCNSCGVISVPAGQGPSAQPQAQTAQAAPQAAQAGGGPSPRWYPSVVAAACIATEDTDAGLVCSSAYANQLDMDVGTLSFQSDPARQAMGILYSAYRHEGLALIFQDGLTLDDKLQLIEQIERNEEMLFQVITNRIQQLAAQNPVLAAQIYTAAMVDTARANAIRDQAQTQARQNGEQMQNYLRQNPGEGQVHFRCADACGQLINISIHGWGGI